MSVSPPLLKPMPISRDQQIRDLFVRMTKQNGGPVTMRDLAQECISTGIYEPHQLVEIQVQGVMKSCRSALTRRDGAGLPFAGPTSPAASPEWEQRALWDVDVYTFNVAEHIADRDEAHQVAKALVDECLARYGVRLALLPLP